MKYRDFIKLLESNGFALKRQTDTHHHYEGIVEGVRRLVTLDYSRAGEDIGSEEYGFYDTPIRLT